MMSKFWEESDGSGDVSSGASCTSSSDDARDDDDNDSGVRASHNKHAALESAPDKLSGNVDESWRSLQQAQLQIEPLRRIASASFDASERDGCTRLVCMSDTHGQHREVFLPHGDVLIHGGDITKSGEIGTIQDLSRFFGESSFTEIVTIAGNHDITLDPDYYQRSWQRFHREPFDTNVAQASLKNCTYLRDDSCSVAQGKVKIYGSPWTPEFYDWAFNLPRGKQLRNVWSSIPSDTDVLITHGPPLGRCDMVAHGVRTGCYDLLQEVQQRVKPRVHVFGHIHEGYGASFDGQTLYVNASNLDLRYQPTNPCIVIDVPHNTSQPAVLVVPNCTLSGSDFIAWCGTKGYAQLAALLDDLTVHELPSGNDLLKADVFKYFVEKLHLHRLDEARDQLRCALSQLIAESY